MLGYFRNHLNLTDLLDQISSSLLLDIAKVITEEPPIVIESDKETSKLYKNIP